MRFSPDRNANILEVVILLLVQLDSILLPKLFTLVHRRPTEMTRLQLARPLVIRCETLEPRRQFLLQELDIFHDVFIGPLPRRQVLSEWEELADEHSGEVGGGCFCDEVAEGGDNNADNLFFDSRLGDFGEAGDDIVFPAEKG